MGRVAYSVAKMLCARRRFFRAVFRGPYMLKFVATCSNVLVPCLLSVWVIGGIELDVYTIVIIGSDAV